MFVIDIPKLHGENHAYLYRISTPLHSSPRKTERRTQWRSISEACVRTTAAKRQRQRRSGTYVPIHSWRKGRRVADVAWRTFMSKLSISWYELLPLVPVTAIYGAENLFVPASDAFPSIFGSWEPAPLLRFANYKTRHRISRRLSRYFGPKISIS